MFYMKVKEQGLLLKDLNKKENTTKSKSKGSSNVN